MAWHSILFLNLTVLHDVKKSIIILCSLKGQSAVHIPLVDFLASFLTMVVLLEFNYNDEP